MLTAKDFQKLNKRQLALAGKLPVKIISASGSTIGRARLAMPIIQAIYHRRGDVTLA